LQREIRTAAKAVCNEEFPRDSVYLFSHACYAGTARDALAQLDRIRTSHASRDEAAGSRVAIMVVPRQ
jgi:hypothetical protein